MILCFILAGGCSRYTVSNKVVIPNAPIETLENSEASFLEIKSRWTVVLGSVRGGGTTGMMSGGRGSRGSGRFPLTVRATLMDEQVIEAGLLYYDEMASMSVIEDEIFRQDYREHHELDRYMLIEAHLETTGAENYLDFSRYTIFLQDDQGNQYDLSKIVEMPLFNNRFEESSGRSSVDRPFTLDSNHHQKNAFLYFPQNDFYGQPIIHENLEYLKIVFILEKGGSGRAEGSWVFDSK